MGDMGELAALTIADARDKMRAGEVTSREITEDCLNAIEAAKPLNAFTAVTADKALDMADLPAEVRGTIPFTLGTVWLLTCYMQDATGENEFPGDYRNGALDFGWDKLDEATKTKKRTIELNQGRAAMMGITGLMVHEFMGVSILPGGYLP